MTCFNPKYAQYTYRRLENGKFGKDISFITKEYYKKYYETHKKLDEYDKYKFGLIIIPCGKCIGCKVDKAKEWATRCVYESKQWKNNCFITLTYSDQYLKSKSLIKKDIIDFMKRLRKQEKGIEPREYKGEIEYPIRYFYSGEYGETYHRPHFHIGFFNYIPNDLKFWRYDENGNPEYLSKKIAKIWGKGFILVKRMTYETATYIARYTMKKLFDIKGIYKEKKIEPEFIETSRRGGIGYQLLEKKDEYEKMLRNFGIYINTRNGVKLRGIPRFYRNKILNGTELERLEFFTIADKHKMQTEDNFFEQLAKTNYTVEEYLQIQKRTLIDKLKMSKSTKRNRINKQLQLSI